MPTRIHNISGLKAAIKTSASETRQAREEARTLSGLDRHWALVDAEDPDARYLHLAYGYLRGRTISQMESETTRSDNFPSADRILSAARPYFNQGLDAEESPASWDEFEATIRTDIKQWKARCLTTTAMRQAQTKRQVA